MGTPAAHPALSLPDEIVVRPDPARYRRRFLMTGGALGVIVLVCLALAIFGEDPAMRVGVVLGALLAGGIGALSLKWQRATYLDPEPALVLQRQQFRILHKGQHLWVPWTDVQDVSVLRRGAGMGRSEILRLDLRPEATGRLPGGRAPLLDRMFSWSTNDLAYSRPGDTPPFQEVATAAAQLHDHATGGAGFRAAQHAHRTQDPRAGQR